MKLQAKDPKTMTRRQYHETRAAEYEHMLSEISAVHDVYQCSSLMHAHKYMNADTPEDLAYHEARCDVVHRVHAHMEATPYPDALDDKVD